MDTLPPPGNLSGGEAARRITAFQGSRRVAGGALPDVLPAIEAARRRDLRAPLLVFDDATGHLVELDLRSPAGRHSQQRGAPQPNRSQDSAPAPVARGAGRPKLGVVGREVTLLPRHWEWLNRQPGGASVTLRKLVEEARRSGASRDRVREAQEATYRFLLAIAGDLPGYEEAMRALFASRRERFEALMADWPTDIREHALRLAEAAFPGATSSGSRLPDVA